MSEEWPYPEPARPPPKLDRPTWKCPEATCVCHPIDDSDEEVEVKIVMRDHELSRLPNAICRIEAPALIGEQVTRADGQGRLTAQFLRRPRSIDVSWAPAQAPQGHPYPCRKRFYVDLPADDRVEAAARRLHNLGFSDHSDISHNIADFQRSFGYTLTAELDDAEGPLVLHHDEAADPGGAVEAQAGFTGLEGQPAQDPGASSPGAGTLGTPPNLPTVFEVDLLHIKLPFAPIKSTWQGHEAVFWVTRDAVKWSVVGDAYRTWYDPPTSPDPLERGLGAMLCRLPMTARGQQALADNVFRTPVQLAGRDHAPSLPAESALLLTSKLYDLRYAAADCRISPKTTSPNVKLIFENSKKTTFDINTEVNARFPGDPPRIIADPGKAWILTHDIGQKKAENNGHYAAVNYGFHTSVSSRIQGPGYKHCACHYRDYSQVCFLVAGWCKVKEEGASDYRWHTTESIYRHKTLFGLAVPGNVPLPRVRYTKFGEFKG